MKGDTFRVNGFSSPKDPLQKVSWYLTGYLVISFYIFIGTNFSLPKHYLWLIIVINIYYTILIAIVVYYGYKATKTNVCDDYVNERNEHMNTNYTIETFREKYSNKIVNNELYWCKYCEWYVDKNSKHCRLCNRCTKDFDHHCKWFNNCISHKNYNYFLKCLICINIKLISEIVIILLYIIFEKYDYHSFVSNKLQLILFSFLIVHLVLTMFIFLFLCQLLLFHIYLYFRNMSTYEWILHTRDGKKRKMKIAKEKENEKEKERKNVSNNNNRVAVANAANDDTAISNIDIQMESRNSKAQSYDSNHHLKGKCDYIWYNIHDIMSNIFTFDKNNENKNETRENNHNRNIYQKNEIQIDVQPKSSSIM